jgi:precorrin-2 dehydrogenase/sirohydrochlorin ferrochelatase
MIPIYLDPKAARIALIGRGRLAVSRLAWLRDGGVSPDVWSDAPDSELDAVTPLQRRLPDATEISHYHAVWIVGLTRDESEALGQAARGAGVLVNVEDVPALCDFHTPAVLRRGQLTLTAGTGGASPAVARAARERLQEAFPPAWSEALDDIAQARAALRAREADVGTLIADARSRLARHGLIWARHD